MLPVGRLISKSVPAVWPMVHTVTCIQSIIKWVFLSTIHYKNCFLLQRFLEGKKINTTLVSTKQFASKMDNVRYQLNKNKCPDK